MTTVDFANIGKRRNKKTYAPHLLKTTTAKNILLKN
jgi:hypothetical protein